MEEEDDIQIDPAKRRKLEEVIRAEYEQKMAALEAMAEQYKKEKDDYKKQLEEKEEAIKEKEEVIKEKDMRLKVAQNKFNINLDALSFSPTKGKKKRRILMKTKRTLMTENHDPQTKTPNLSGMKRKC